MTEKNDMKEIEIAVTVEKEIVAPVEKGTKIGELSIIIKDEEIMKIDIIASEDVNKKGIFDYLSEIANFLLCK